MWFRQSYKTRAKFNGPRTTHKSLIDSEFQLRYTLIFVAAAAVCMLLITIPSYYFIHQNYTLFEELAFDTAPGIVEHLRDEKSMITKLYITAFIGFLIFFAFLGLKLTSRMVGPLKVLKNHLKFLSRGQWSQRPVDIRQKDEFQDVISSYNYFYLSFQQQIRKDLELLKTIEVGVENKESYNNLKILIEEKVHQLNLDDQYKVHQLKFDKDSSKNEITSNKKIAS